MNTLIGSMIVAGVMVTAAAPPEARADVVVIVSATSNASTVTIDDLSRIYLGKSNKMKPVDIEERSRTRREFYAKVTGKDDAQVRAIWSKLVFAGKVAAPKELSSGADVVKAVADDPDAIGYVDRSFVNMTVKIVYVVK